MAASRLPRLGQGQPTPPTQSSQGEAGTAPAESPRSAAQTKPDTEGVRADTTEATRLYQRGVAAARGGQRRVAVGLLTRSVQLDPNNEGAWLWLSGVLDDPHQTAFCLNAVLKLNPANERARKGLRWLEERQLLKGEAPPAPFMDVNVGEPLRRHSTSASSNESWWVGWRQWHKDVRSVRLLVWSIPLILVFLALVLYQTFAYAVAQVGPPPAVPTTAPQQPTLAIAALPTAMPLNTAVEIAPLLNEQPAALRERDVIAYIGTVNPIRKELRAAVDDYRDRTGKPGSTVIAHAAAAQKLRTRVEDAREQLAATKPPQAMNEAHRDYLAGLDTELEAIDAMVAFYGSYQAEHANRAALLFQDANRHFQRANARYESTLYEIKMTSSVSTYTMR